MGSCLAEWTEYNGFEAMRLANDLVTLWAVPGIGGRILQAECDGHGYLWVNRALRGPLQPSDDGALDFNAWLNYGGEKIWPAPQGPDDGEHWQGPPDPALDGARYRGQIVSSGPGEVRAHMESPRGNDKWGIQFSRQIVLRPDETRVSIRTTMRNIVERPVRWSIWQVAQLDAAGPEAPGYNAELVGYALSRRRSGTRGGYRALFGDPGNPAWSADNASRLVSARFNYQVGKLGIDSEAGWAVTVDGRARKALAQVFTGFPGAEYPDHGSSVAFWVNGAGSFEFLGNTVDCVRDVGKTPPFLEAEVLSPLVTLNPGDEFSFDILWGMGEATGVPAAATGAGLVTDLAASRNAAGQVRCQAQVTPFVTGRCAARALDRSGGEVARSDLGTVAAGRCHRVDAAWLAPEAQSIELTLSPNSGDETVLLVRCHLQGVCGSY